MKETQIIMGMPVILEIADKFATPEALKKTFDYFRYVDEKFSTYKTTSEISAINRSELKPENYSADMKEVLALCEETKKLTDGYFDIHKSDDTIDPSGLVKGWAIFKAAQLLEKMGFKNFYVDAGGDIQVAVRNSQGEKWRIGIQNPFASPKIEIIKTVAMETEGVATSGTYIRGQHIYNPKERKSELTDIVSLTVIGPNIYEADRFATAAFAMGRAGINFIENLEGFEAYMIDSQGVATLTTNFNKYII